MHKLSVVSPKQEHDTAFRKVLAEEEVDVVEAVVVHSVDVDVVAVDITTEVEEVSLS